MLTIHLFKKEESYSLIGDDEGIISMGSNSSNPRQLNHWRSSQNSSFSSSIRENHIAVKFFYRSEIEVLIVKRLITLRKLQKYAKTFSKLNKLQLEVQNLHGISILLTSSSQLQSVIAGIHLLTKIMIL